MTGLHLIERCVRAAVVAAGAPQKPVFSSWNFAAALKDEFDLRRQPELEAVEGILRQLKFVAAMNDHFWLALLRVQRPSMLKAEED